MCDIFSLLLSAVIDYSLVVKLKTFFIGEVMWFMDLFADILSWKSVFFSFKFFFLKWGLS